jgi:hypothetical protein
MVASNLVVRDVDCAVRQLKRKKTPLCCLAVLLLVEYYYCHHSRDEDQP